MTSTVVAIIICERCGQAGQTSADWRMHPLDDDEGSHSGHYEAKRPDTWRGPLRLGDRKFNIAVSEIVPDTEGLTDERWILRTVDVCPTCRMAFLTWWLEGRA